LLKPAPWLRRSPHPPKAEGDGARVGSRRGRGEVNQSASKRESHAACRALERPLRQRKLLALGGCQCTAAAHRRSKVNLWNIPPRSPEISPTEKYWGWLRRALLKRDLEDLRKGRPVPGRTAYIARVRAINPSKRAQTVAASYARGLKKVCQAVVRKRGVAVKG
jgi:hypothetical protein